MPIDYKDYPKNWTDIRAVVLARAGEQRDRYEKITQEARCEECGLMNHIKYHRLDDEHVEWCCDWPVQSELCSYCWEARHDPVLIVLTIAHLDHDAANDEVCVTRLRALCQKCHLAYDAPMRSMHKDRKRGQTLLIPWEI
ncbi:hypothetical protein LCGC14_1137770 [marine sediment metagenome]|uniref:HNH endonuclease n=1 Tax=marine sediment metagenome TaxID=412755 RepID=A0A0F9Q4X7_9ZZZZ